MTWLVIDGVSKVFGDGAAIQAALPLIKSPSSPDDIRAATNANVAVRDISFSVARGELFAIVGLSGSGKSTLVRCINRLVEPTTGLISLDGVDITNASPSQLRDIRQKQISMVFQHFALLPHKTVLENVEYGLRVAGKKPAARREKALAMIEVVGLSRWVDAYPEQLSGGMRQRVGIARALACEPQVLLMDEPFGALDPLIRRDMQQELRSLQAQLKKTIIFITHDLHEAMLLGDRVAVMRNGTFVQVGRPDEILSNPADEYVSDFTSDVNKSRFMNVGAICKPAVAIEEHGLSLQVVAQCQSDAIYVVDGNGKPTGIIERDRLDHDKPGTDADVARLVRREFGSLTASSNIEDCYGLISSYGIVAVISADGKLYGQLSARDLAGYLASDVAESSRRSTH